jgi:hypothetical protein
VGTDNQRRRLARIEIQEQWMFEGSVGEATRYSLIDDQVYLWPNPSTGTYKIRYVPQSTDLSDYEDDDIVDVVTADGEAMLIWGVAALALTKAKRDASEAFKQTAIFEERLICWAAQRSMVDPQRRITVDADDYPIDPGDYR